jgi:RluA family pseudouridine synthase
VTAPEVIHREGALWVLAKPSGLAAHPTGTNVPDVITWALEHAGAPPELAPVHRLDRETSGVMVCATDPALRAELGERFARGEVEKRYRALVHGRTHAKGILRRPLPDGRRGRPLPAVTRYRCVERLGRVSLLEVRPETGRTHQIRRHLAGVGHAIVGDERYPPPRFSPVAGFPGRLWLHAISVALPDGRTFVAPLPDELAEHLALLREREGLHD